MVAAWMRELQVADLHFDIVDLKIAGDQHAFLDVALRMALDATAGQVAHEVACKTGGIVALEDREMYPFSQHAPFAARKVSTPSLKSSRLRTRAKMRSVSHGVSRSRPVRCRARTAASSWSAIGAAATLRRSAFIGHRQFLLQ